jgi:hypothetical protein
VILIARHPKTPPGQQLRSTRFDELGAAIWRFLAALENLIKAASRNAKEDQAKVTGRCA